MEEVVPVFLRKLGRRLIMGCDVLEIVRNSRRRAFLNVLKELGGKACLREIVKRIAEMERGPDFSSRHEKSIHISLLQTHLPKMENAGLIEYDEKRGVVRLLELPSEVRYHLEVVEKGDIFWRSYYFFLSLVCVALSLVFVNLLAFILSSCFMITAIIQLVENKTSLLKTIKKRSKSLH